MVIFAGCLCDWLWRCKRFCQTRHRSDHHVRWHSLPPIIITVQWTCTNKSGPPKSFKGVCLEWWGLYRCKTLHVCMHASICELVYMHLVVWLALALPSILSRPLSQWSPRALAFITTNHYHHAIHAQTRWSTQIVQRCVLEMMSLYRCKALYVCMYASICEWVSMHLVVWLALGLPSTLSRPLSQWSPRALAFITTNHYCRAILRRKQTWSTQIVQRCVLGMTRLVSV